ncbi:MAG: hypothetical protein Q7S12_04600 [bacterium]|nr:hypothetical protein [bacterium]
MTFKKYVLGTIGAISLFVWTFIGPALGVVIASIVGLIIPAFSEINSLARFWICAAAMYALIFLCFYMLFRKQITASTRLSERWGSPRKLF